MGKTSLMARVLHHARSREYKTAVLSFQIANGALFRDLPRLLRWVCVMVGKSLNLAPAFDKYWSDLLDDNTNCTTYFDEYLLSNLSEPFILALDEVDRVFEDFTVAGEFFSLLRAWYERGKDSTRWGNLRLIIVHSTESYITLHANQSPFNVGLSIKPQEFTGDQVRALAIKHGLLWSPADQQCLLNLVGGHPYLIRVALYYLAKREVDLATLLTSAATEAGIYSDHLRRHLWNLQQFSSLTSAFKQVLATRSPTRIDSELAWKLTSMGLLRLRGNDVVVSCDLYRRYFEERLK
jgi:AAA-like domain